MTIEQWKEYLTPVRLESLNELCEKRTGRTSALSKVEAATQLAGLSAAGQQAILTVLMLEEHETAT
jgi:hypothetical protein